VESTAVVSWSVLIVAAAVCGSVFILAAIALVAVLASRRMSPRQAAPRRAAPVAAPRERAPSSSHPILRGIALFVLLLLAIVGLWLVAFVVYLSADRPGGPPSDAMPVALVGLAFAVGCGTGFVLLTRRPPAPADPSPEPAPGYRLLVVGWVVGGLLAVGIPLAAFATGNTSRMESLIFSVVGSCSAPLLVVLVLVTVGRLVWLNRKRWAESLSYAHPVAPQPTASRSPRPADPDPIPTPTPVQTVLREPRVILAGTVGGLGAGASIILYLVGRVIADTEGHASAPQDGLILALPVLLLTVFAAAFVLYVVPGSKQSGSSPPPRPQRPSTHADPVGSTASRVIPILLVLLGIAGALWRLAVGAPPGEAIVLSGAGLVMAALFHAALKPRAPRRGIASTPDEPPVPAPRRGSPALAVLGGAVVLLCLILGLTVIGLKGVTYGVQEEQLSPAGWFVGGLCGALAILASIGLFMLLRSAVVSPAMPSNSPVATPGALDEPLPSSAILPPRAARHCPKCGATIAADAAEGLCPRCLIRGALAPPPHLSPTTAYGGFTPPTVEEVAEFFPHLEVHGLIGQGGMGAVYLATQKALDRPVALKIIRVRDDDPTFEERFVREAKAMARLSHPNIVAIHDHGTAGGLPYLVLEYVDGVTLRDAMRAKRLTPAEALKIIPQVCDALEYAHAQGVVHRDVKPENILLDRSGKVKIADFGLAKVADPSGVSLTHTRQAMGTPHYMAPEQWEKPSEVDHRADIYALGVVLYELLTGELPLGRFDPPSVKAAVDARVDELILRALAKEPDRRFQHATDVKSALAVIAAGGYRGRCGTFYEYKSKTTFLGLPLVHVTRGLDPITGRLKPANGWIAVSDTAAVGGIAVGGATAAGGIAVGGAGAVGVVAIGGGGAMGVLAFSGGLAIGALVAVGGGVAASFGFALGGGIATGKFAVGGGAVSGEHVIKKGHADESFWSDLENWLFGGEWFRDLLN
jgi:tRNA A-37 threonylcarbamoyl transferase component Bud32